MEEHMRRLLMVTVATFLFAVTAFADDEMKKLDFLAGTWSGEAWIQMGPEKRELVVQTESVKPKLGGRVLLIEGVGRRKNENGTGGEVVHDALAVISWDPAKKAYRFSAYTAQYGAMDTTLDVTGENTAVWGMDVPGGRMRYTIRLTDKGAWNEIGEFSRDGKTWFKFLEMNLEKMK
jgi:hypothetical protein